MRIRLYATLRQTVGQRDVDIPVEAGDTVRTVLERLLSRYPDLRPRILDEAGEPQRAVNLFLNGRMIDYLDNLNTPVQDGDELAIFPPVAGG
jgi:molybdopterin synthase sulfur carrier subunit